MMKCIVTSSYDVQQPVCEDPDASVPAVTDGSQLEVQVKPVPRPRSKVQPNTNNNSDDSVDKTNIITNVVGCQLNEYQADYKSPPPVRPPRPPVSKHVTSSEPTAAVDGDDHYMNTETAEKPPAVSTEIIQSPPPPRPERPPLPSIYYGKPFTTRPKSEIHTNECQQSSRSSFSSIQQTPVSPTLCDEVSTDCPDRPAVPPRPPHSAPVCDTSPPQTRPPLPPFSPPPPPSIEGPLESVYSEIEYRPYLDILPDDDDDRRTGRPALRFRQNCQTGCYSPCQQTSPDTEDIYVMLRWLKIVSKSDYMAPSLYGLNIEEEIRSFSQRATNVRKALRLYNLLMMKRNESLRDLIAEFRSISNSLDKVEKKTKTMSIAGGTTGAVGGMTAVLGIALAPVTMGTSLIATAVGAGMVASAGGMGAQAAKANKKIVNRMTVEKLVYEYKANVVDLEHCLDFILSGMNELRRHDIARLQRAGAQTDALKMAHLSQSVIRNNMNNDRKCAHAGGMPSGRLLQAFAKEMDHYFTEDQRLKQSNKSKFSGRVRLLAQNLQDELDHLNRMWEMFS
ncbi:uncharacterized protein LOC121621149 isoform X2 [Chelmon rostratus]|nr:uncharacterized protein LOC121621149 isoform X2 [Chelmon rostratus]